MSFLDTIKGLFFGAADAETTAVYAGEGDAGRVIAALRGVIDPELGKDVVHLGMIRGVSVVAGVARIRLTPTTAGCPLTGWLTTACEQAVASIGLQGTVELVLDPPWAPSDIEG
ncbi:MAG: metal-sulfur cluster assembly factor [Pseudomonadota bacterium]|nr:metal-sulfur cluster assembly factor [Pseudomonadota bacterium]